jgi:hypothetical protein
MKRRLGGLPAKTELREIAAGITALPAALDLMHVTVVGRGTEIVRARQIDMQPCKVFGRNLVYTFIARPAYKVVNNEEKSDEINRFPFVFVISPRKLGKPFHIYPFDTGAGVSGIYGDMVDPYVMLEDYQLEPDLTAAQRHIAWAFGTNQAYFDGELTAGLRDTLPHFNTVAPACLKIAELGSASSNRPDRRASAIEVAYQRHVPLKEHVRLVIVPQPLVEDQGKQNTLLTKDLDKLGIPWKTYDWRPNETPASFMDEITRLVRHFLERRRQI